MLILARPCGKYTAQFCVFINRRGVYIMDTMKQDNKSLIVAVAGIALNLVLAAGKIAAGLIFSLVSVVADGVNNLSDCGSGAVVLVSMRVSKKPADREHPYGHQRAEYVASMLIGCIILVFAVELLRESIEKCIAGTLTTGGLWLYLVLGVSVAVKAGMAVMYGVQARATKSQTMRAAALDSLSDCIATTAVIVGAIVSSFAALPADGYAGILVAVFIAWEGISVLRDAGSALLGRAPDKELVERIRAIILRGEGVLGVHDLKIYRFGPEKFFATAHIETDASLSVTYAHGCLDEVERAVERETGVSLTAHCDPVALGDEEATELETRIRAAVTGMYRDMDVHDFRLVRGARKKIVFEVGVPFDCKAKDGEIEASVLSAVRLLTDIEASVTIERE